MGANVRLNHFISIWNGFIATNPVFTRITMKHLWILKVQKKIKKLIFDEYQSLWFYRGLWDEMFLGSRSVLNFFPG